VFHALTDYLWRLTYKWACWTHPNKPKRWIISRYYRKFNKYYSRDFTVSSRLCLASSRSGPVCGYAKSQPRGLAGLDYSGVIPGGRAASAVCETRQRQHGRGGQHRGRR
jgi:hypothetical protein